MKRVVFFFVVTMFLSLFVFASLNNNADDAPYYYYYENSNSLDEKDRYIDHLDEVYASTFSHIDDYEYQDDFDDKYNSDYSYADDFEYIWKKSGKDLYKTDDVFPFENDENITDVIFFENIPQAEEKDDEVLALISNTTASLKVEDIDDIIIRGAHSSDDDFNMNALGELKKRNDEENTKALINDNKTSENEGHHFYTEGTFGPTIRFLRGINFAIGGHIAVNFFVVPELSFGPYIHGEYFLAPLGSTSGLLAGLEMELEAGMNITFPVYKSPHFTVKIGSDIGYYMQWLQYNSDISSDAHLTYNGLLIRPTVTFDFLKLAGMPIGISLFYQTTVMMPYEDYNGFGIMLNL